MHHNEEKHPPQNAPNAPNSLTGKVALISGGGKRIGACLAQTLHGAGMTVAIHYRHSAQSAQQLQQQLLQIRPDSALIIQADLSNASDLKALISRLVQRAGRLDALVNNAAAFYPTPISTANEQQWQQLIDTNLKAPFFLSQAAAPYLTKTHGSIINIVDIYADRPLPEHPIYCATKAGLVSLTKSFAQSLAPQVRVNGIAPGAILWPTSHDNGGDKAAQQSILSNIPLQTTGTPQAIGDAALFLIQSANYITGQIINIDGGRTVVA